MNEATKLIPPFRYAIVEEGVFRGAYPTEKNFRFLRRYRQKKKETINKILSTMMNVCHKMIDIKIINRKYDKIK